MKNDITERLMTIALSILILQSLFRIFGLIDNEFVDPTKFFEFTFFAVAFLSLRLENVGNIILSFLIILSWATVVLLSYLEDAPVYESIRAYKWLLYLVAILCIGEQSKLRNAWLRKYYLTLLTSMTFFYTFLIFRDGFSTRPQLLLENNYECAFLIGLFVLNFSQRNLDFTRKNLAWNIALVTTVILSGSRSALISLILVLSGIYLAHRNFSRLKIMGFILSISTLIVALLSWMIRGSSLQSVDRFVFLQLFLHEYSLKSDISKLLGAWVINPLSSETCVKLRFYSVLQNDESLGSCFSVILHSFILRSLYDFGLIGTLAIFFAYVWLLRRNLESTLVICITAIAIANSMSVSGINNVYVVMPACIALMMENKSHILRKGAAPLTR